MRILHVIHGFPPEYMAGSEVYTYNLCKELSKSHEIIVIYRISNPFLKEYEIEEGMFKGIKVFKINIPSIPHNFKKRYRNPKIDEIFQLIIKKIDPEIVHISHLNYLSTTLIKIFKENNIPILCTLHDYWFMCPRGQLITPEFERCEKIDFNVCGTCLNNYFTSLTKASLKLKERDKYIRELLNRVDLFVAPSKFLRNKFIKWGINDKNIIYSDYGFNTQYFENFQKKKSKFIRFGYTGRIIPNKGVHLLVDAFNKIKNESIVLKIYGKKTEITKYLKERVENSNISFEDPYDNWDIAKVLSEIDVLIIPSIWVENSPLVIHEAFLGKIPVITSNIGGMAELVKHNQEGLLFKVGDVEDLVKKINFFIENPDLIQKFGNNAPDVKTIEEDARFISSIYEKLKRDIW